MKDKFTIWCETCDHTWTQNVDGLGYIDWVCPKCKLKDETFIINYEPGDPNFYKRKLEMGKGGAKHA